MFIINGMYGYLGAYKMTIVGFVTLWQLRYHEGVDITYIFAVRVDEYLCWFCIIRLYVIFVIICNTGACIAIQQAMAAIAALSHEGVTERQVSWLQLAKIRETPFRRFPSV